ncbi:29467_t:CDS:2, partial [Gigaspora margarita]
VICNTKNNKKSKVTKKTKPILKLTKKNHYDTIEAALKELANSNNLTVTVKELKLLKERIQSLENEIELSKKDNELIKKDLALFQPIKRRKTLLFNCLFNNDKSLQELEEVEELARKTTAEKQTKHELESAQRKQTATEKQAKQKLESAPRNQRKVEAACKKKE